jgi:hypothetical protein
VRVASTTRNFDTIQSARTYLVKTGKHKFYGSGLVCSEHVGNGYDKMGEYAKLCNRTPKHPIHDVPRFRVPSDLWLYLGAAAAGGIVALFVALIMWLAGDL